jgi:hypothetical protein
MRKKDNLLRGDRTPAYVDRETGAAVLGAANFGKKKGIRRDAA